MVYGAAEANVQRYLASVSAFSEIGYDDYKLPVINGLGFTGAQLAYLLSAISMVCITLVLYMNKGAFVIGRILCYLFSLSTITLSIKNVYVSYDYNFPRFVSFLHILVSGSIAFMVLFYRQYTTGAQIRFPKMQDFSMSIVPIAICFSANIVSNNIALAYMGAGFVEMIGGCAPIFVFCITCVNNKHINHALLAPVLVVCIGTAMCAEGELRFSLFGLGLALTATFLRSLKSILQHSLMKSDTPMDPIEVLAWLSVPSMIIMGLWSGLAEGSKPLVVLHESSRPGLYVALAVSCFNAIMLNFSNLFVIRDLGALGVNIVAQLKGILIILGGVAMLGERVALMQVAGYFTLVAGVFFYNKVESSLDKKEQTRLIGIPDRKGDI